LILAVLFFSKRRIFPVAGIVLGLINILWGLVLKIALLPFVTGEPRLGIDTIRGAAWNLMIGAIWIAYLLRSRRVKNTFVN